MLDIKVAHQGLIIVIIPLLCELIALGAILNNIDKTEKLIAEEAVSKEIMKEANALTRAIYESGDAIAGYSYNKSPKNLDKLKKKMDVIQEIYQRLKVLSKGDIKRLDRVYTLKKYSDRMVTLFVAQGMPVDLGGQANRNTDVRYFREKAGKIYRPLLSSIETIIAQEQILVRKNAREIREYQGQLRTLIICAIYLSIAISIILILYFSRRVTTRLGILNKNITRFLNREPLESKIGGSDEIAELDSSFHQMAENLTLLENRKQEFVSMISHDIRSPLSQIQSTLAVLEKEQFGKLDATGKKRLQNAEHNIDKVNRMINDLLTIDRLESGELELDIEEAILSSLVDEAIKSVSGPAADREIVIENQSEAASVDLDVFRMEQVLVNFLSNAIKFSDRKDKIIVASEVGEETVKIKVLDEGKGIPEEKVETIFDRFSQVEQSDAKEKKGFGLGLSICRGLVESHGGSIGVESVEGEGSTFWVEIPRYQA